MCRPWHKMESQSFSTMKDRTLGNTPRSLRRIAEQLGNRQLSTLVATYGEYNASQRRVMFLVIVGVWTLYWARFAGPASQHNTLPVEASLLLPWIPLALWLALVWMLAIRLKLVPRNDLSDGFGAAANILGIGLMLHVAWNICIAMIVVMPFTTILVGARLGRRAFLVAMLCTVAAVGLSAPTGYWVSRPAFIPFALLLLCGLPLTVNRLLATLTELSNAAILSRNAQERFLAIMSHELRTPLNTVIHSSNLIDTRHLSGEDLAMLHAVQVNANALLQRVNEVLDVTAIATGRLHILRQPYLLHGVLQQVRDMMTQPAQSKGVLLRVNEGTAADLHLVGDAARLEQSLTNLLTNAIKFTPSGGIVSLEVTATSQSLRCVVSDTGIGISAGDKQSVFEPFFQAGVKPARSSANRGVGLGLHIVKSFCDLSGGGIEVRDRPGGGTIFSMELPLILANPHARTPPETETVSSLDSHRQHVRALACLVVDDNEPNREITGRLLRRAGHEVFFAADGRLALALLRGGQHIDLVLLDMHMPGKSGMQVLGELRDEPVACNPAVAMISADSDPEVVERAIGLGAVAYLTKPILIPRLLGLLEQVAGQTAQRIGSHFAKTPGAIDGPLSIDLFRRLCSAEEVTRYLHMSDAGLERSWAQLSAASDAETRSSCIHDLKNVFLAIGRQSGVTACSRLHRVWTAGGDATNALNRLRAEVAGTRAYLAAQPEFLKP